jgi:Peptidase propeptide and YPEB domain
MKLFVISMLLLVPLSVSAAGLKCSIHPAKGTPTSALPGIAKVSQADAQKTALAKIKAPPTAVTEGELEVEQGCLVYSFYIRIPGKPGIEEIMVDAGTGKILSHKHESTKQEAAEKAKDKAYEKKQTNQ